MKNKKTFLMVLIVILYFSIIVTVTNGFGAGDSAGDSDMVLVKYNSSGVQQWDRTWGGIDDDRGWGVAVDSSDNVYLAGITRSFGAGESDMVLVKYDSSGVQQWNRTWGGIVSDLGWGVAVDSSDNVYLSGSTRTPGPQLYDDMILVKYDSSGVQQWNRTWGGIDDANGKGVAVDSSDNVYLSGCTRSFEMVFPHNMVLVKYNSSGVQQWNRTWGGIDGDHGSVPAVDSSDNVYLAGYTYSFGVGDSDMVLVKYDSSGVKQWNRTWGGIVGDRSWGVVVDSSDNVYLSGWTRSFGAGYSDMVLVKYDSSGVQQWNRTWGGIDEDGGSLTAVDSSDNVYISGWTVSFGAGDSAGYGDMVLVKYDSSGVQQWNRTWGGIDDGWGVAVDSSDNVYLAGDTSKREEEPPISGYDLLLFISVIGVITAITAIFLNKKYNK